MSPDKEKYQAVQFGKKLRTWRRLNNIKQEALAHMLGISQPNITRWEQGLDTPSPERLSQIKSLMSGVMRDELALERLFIQRQRSIRALIALDGVRYRAFSKGYQELWPTFGKLEGVAMADFLINELRAFMDDDVLGADLRKGAVGLISGVSERHFDLGIDPPVLHQWHVCMRRYDGQMFADIVFEPCANTFLPGITDISHLDALGDVITL